MAGVSSAGFMKIASGQEDIQRRLCQGNPPLDSCLYLCERQAAKLKEARRSRDSNSHGIGSNDPHPPSQPIWRPHFKLLAKRLAKQRRSSVLRWDKDGAPSLVALETWGKYLEG